MAAFTSSVAVWLAAHHGVASRDELIALHLSGAQIDRLVSQRILLRVHRGVYRVASSPDTFESRCRAACAACADIVVCGVSAARLWGLRKVAWEDTVYVLAPDLTTPLSRGVVVRRCRAPFDSSDVVVRDDGIRLTSPHRTVFELAARLGDDALESVIEQVLDNYCTPPTLWGMVRRLARRGRVGTARMRRVLDSRPIYYKPKDSDLEVRVLRALRARGVELEPQVPLAIPGFGTPVLDGADRALRWGLEVDHVTWHGGRREWERDIARGRACRRLRWVVERVTDSEVRADFEHAMDELASSYFDRRNELMAS